MPSRELRTYFLPTLGITEFLRFQRRLQYEVSEEPERGSLIVCDHPFEVSLGREGSRTHLRGSLLKSRWIARGGGTLLHAPGQIAIYPILPLQSLKLSAAAYRDHLRQIVRDVLASYQVAMRVDETNPGIFIGERLVAHLGVAVRSGITAFGMTLNVDCELDAFHEVLVDGLGPPMTSLTRESPLRVRRSTLRQQLAEAIATGFGFDGLTVFHHHPALLLQQTYDPHAHHR